MWAKRESWRRSRESWRQVPADVAAAPSGAAAEVAPPPDADAAPEQGELPLPRRRSDGAMTLADKRLLLCSCNGTMPLDANALARALDLAPAPAVRSMMCQKELGAFAADAAGDLVVACTQEARLFGDVAEEGGKAQAIRFVNIRETGGWSSEASHATPKIAALLAAAAMPEPEPVPRVAYQSSGQLVDRRAAARGAAVGAGAGRSARRHRARDRCSRPGRAAGAARLSRALRHADGDRRLARRVRGRVDAGQSDRSRSLHPLQRVHRRVSRARDRLPLPGRPRPLPRPSRVRRRLRRGRCDRLRPHRSRPARALRHRARPARRRAVVRAAPAAAGLLRARSRPARAGEGHGGARDAARRVREAEVLRATRRRSARTAGRARPAARSASTSARPARYAPTAIT